MKTHKYLLIGVVAISSLTLSSCLKDQEDVFDGNASERMQTYLSEAQKTLMSAENGWALDYYPDRNQSYGGFAYAIKFTSSSATVSSVLLPGESITSLYKMSTDNGPMLSFDSYNTLMHFFATPDGNNYEAYDGDFEFVIDSVASDLVKIHGKRSGNTMYFRKLAKSPEKFIADADSVAGDLFVLGGEGTIGGSALSMSLDYDYQLATFTSGTETVEEPFTIIDDGVRFYKPVTIAGKTFSELPYNSTTFLFSGTCTDGTAISLTAQLPDNYVKFPEYEGDYWLHYSRTSTIKDSCRVTLTPGTKNKTYIMSGLNDNYTVTLNFQKSTGKLEWNSQKIGEYGGNNIWICAWGYGTTPNGSLTWDTEAGMETTWNGDKDNPVYKFGPNSFSDFKITSFIMWKLTPSGSSGGSFTGVNSWRINNNTYRIYLLDNLTKIN
ncbi:MAG: DUF4302 domain-containing protein [Bacteroidales bacterium]|jgi:hypothetical protein|nr:DUF4302 domain-containing protein [Bacteroidales bacterium]MCI2133947.1 DUF4302 domain-containing protein [Bacteroidales bacterium]